MLRVYMWAIVGAACVGLIFSSNSLFQGTMQGVILFIINLRYSLNQIQGRVFKISCFCAAVLSGISIILYQHSINSVILLWIYFSAINKFGNEFEARISSFCRYSLLLGYLYSATLLFASLYYDNNTLQGYGLIGIVLIMSALCFFYVNQEERDIEKASIAICIILGLLIGRFAQSTICLWPTVVLSSTWVIYDITFYLRNMDRVS